MATKKGRAIVQPIVIRSPVTLADASLAEAEKIIEQGEGDYRMAVILLQIAREQFVELAITRQFNRRKLDSPITDAIRCIIRDFDIASKEKLRDLYEALTKNRITQVRFWQKLKTCANVRNKVAHQGHQPTEHEAKEALESTQLLRDHLNEIESQAAS